MTKEQIATAIAEWTRDEAAQVGPRRVLIGNDFDMLVDRILALQSEADGVARGEKSRPLHQPARSIAQDGKEHLYVHHLGLWYHFPPKDWKPSQSAPEKP